MKKAAGTTDDVKKKILVICQYYKPEPFRVSDICEEMVRRGHEVHVVTGYPNYPEGILYEGYGKGKHIDEVINGVKVHRCFTIPRETGTVKRMMNYYSYAASSTKYVLSKECVASDGMPFDVVYCNQLSPVMMADAAIAYKKKYKVPAVMYCLDLWPESLIAGGITRESVIYKYYHHVSKRIYKQMDKILITSRMFSDYLRDEFGIKSDKIEYLPQYAEGIFEQIPSR
ncbi:glycosyltransferase [Enterococcus dongliensis]|uniref:glycosyltransferase n=1 Tax=Enterococcus dongliensis TaxID=2559925 RepID=UPI0028928E55|nr:glycosyltransferase [Enterococcus dongliensis]MDT2712397.1 glycosyltransferase [Enterococcus dongliensis]